MAVLPTMSRTAELVRRLDECMADEDVPARCQSVKQALEDLIGHGGVLLEPQFLRPAANRYARYLVHRDPALRYTVLAMVWGPGQGTPLHDHASMWCVECVFQGRIRVTSYSLLGRDDAPLMQFQRETEIIAGVGEAGALIPPFEYHTIENADATPSVTIHVYGGEMNWCHAFVPVAGGYQRERRALSYTPMA